MFEVIVPLVVAHTSAGTDRYLYRGEVFDGKGLTIGEAQRLVDGGFLAELVEALEVVEPEPVELAEVVDMGGMTVADLVEYAAEAGIDLGGATRKADILAAIQASE